MKTPMVRTWFPDEIENQIDAVDQSNRSISQAIPTPEMALYRRGFEDAIAALRTSFGLEPGNKVQR